MPRTLEATMPPAVHPVARTVAASALVILSPLLAVAALAVRLSSPGPAFYRAQRLGQRCDIFTMYKLRTMRTGTDAAGSVTTSSDDRITPIGRSLRRWKIDELPQLYNIARGEMSFVGYRPEDPKYYALYPEDFTRVLTRAPGITGAATLRYSQEERLLADLGFQSPEDLEEYYRTRLLPDKLSTEVSYLANRSTWSDTLLVLRTLGSLAGRSRA